MKRLIEKGLMFGNLVAVDSPALVERYNRALKMLTGRQTALTDFHIDLSGYSPEVGDELGDHLYLNARGANRQFILLTTAQKTAPLLNAKFSTSRGILRAFIETNEPQLFALTARDAVAGELDGSVFDISSPARLFDIRTITLRADTTRAAVAEAGKLADRIERFRTEPDAWWDDVLIAQMIELAKVTGDVTRQPVDLKTASFAQGDFWTAHFGGLYIFRDVKRRAAISAGPKEKLGRLPVEWVLDFEDRNGIAQFLARNDLAEPIVQARGVDAGPILQQKMDFILVDAADRLNLDLGGATRRDLRQIAHRMGGELPEEFLGLAALLRWDEDGGAWPRITSEHPAYFYSLRACAGPDRDLVNMLLADLAPLDLRQLFICHKEAFYRAYSGWSERKKAYVADFLEREYLIDKAGARAALFGPEPGMGDDPPGEPARVAPESRARTVPTVGPWGPVPPRDGKGNKGRERR